LKAISRSGRLGSVSLASVFFAWPHALAHMLTRGKTPAPAPAAAVASRSRLASAYGIAKISIYRLIGLNAWAARRLDIYLSLRAYRKAFGKSPNLAQPLLFSEKVMARRLFDRRPDFFTLADKLLAREFAAARTGAQHLPRLHMVCERFEEIDFDRLPDKFVIKTNHGTHWVLFVEDKAALDKDAARRQVNRWLKTNYYVNSREIFYKKVKPMIMIEELLEEDSGAPVLDFRFFVFDGVTKFFSVQQRRVVDGERAITRFTRDFEKLPIPVKSATLDATGAPAKDSLPVRLPPNMEQMFEIAGKLGQGFDFIRVDLYNPSGRILFGELTSLPMGGVRAFDPLICDRIFGQEWNLKLVGAQS
jgi:hypothetical protein